jgi:hypothetical protein
MLIRINKFLNKQRTPILVLSVLFLALGFLHYTHKKDALH